MSASFGLNERVWCDIYGEGTVVAIDGSDHLVQWDAGPLAHHLPSALSAVLTPGERIAEHTGRREFGPY